MEICTMDNSSSSHRYYHGTGSNQMYRNDKYESSIDDEIFANFGGNLDPPPVPVASQQQQSNLIQEHQYPNNIDCQEQPWKSESIECKEEIDHSSSSSGGGYIENYGNHSGYHVNQPVILNRANNNNNNSFNNYNSYQMSTTVKNPMPAWLHPPVPPPHHHSYHEYPPQHNLSYFPSPQNFYPQHHPYQPNYMTSAPSTPAPSSSTTEHNMRNMIQMTANRYNTFFLSNIFFISEMMLLLSTFRGKIYLLCNPCLQCQKFKWYLLSDDMVLDDSKLQNTFSV